MFQRKGGGLREDTKTEEKDMHPTLIRNTLFGKRKAKGKGVSREKGGQEKRPSVLGRSQRAGAAPGRLKEHA